jgi:hypothetical protein
VFGEGGVVVFTQNWFDITANVLHYYLTLSLGQDFKIWFIAITFSAKK